MSSSGQGLKRENPEASADTTAEAIASPNKYPSSAPSLSLDEMSSMAKKLRRHVIMMIGKAGNAISRAPLFLILRKHDHILVIFFSFLPLSQTHRR